MDIKRYGVAQRHGRYVGMALIKKYVAVQHHDNDTGWDEKFSATAQVGWGRAGTGGCEQQTARAKALARAIGYLRMGVRKFFAAAENKNGATLISGSGGGGCAWRFHVLFAIVVKLSF